MREKGKKKVRKITKLTIKEEHFFTEFEIQEFNTQFNISPIENEQSIIRKFVYWITLDS